MDVILFGATGMLGQAVLRECLLDPAVTRVLSIGRGASGHSHEKLRELVRTDLFDYTSIESELRGYDACLFCLGVSSAGMTEDAYRRVTYNLTLAAAETLVRLNPAMTFVFISGAGTDSTERGRVMWARVKGAAENALLRLPFRRTFLLRPVFIQPVHGETSRTASYRIFYRIAAPIVPLARRLFPRYVTTTEQLARAMLVLARSDDTSGVLDTAAINRVPTAG
jgi:uncharacterized protein YbjT (DUF2867 family)